MPTAQRLTRCAAFGLIKTGGIKKKIMWKMLKEYCNYKPLEIIKTLLKAVFVSVIGAAWFYLISLGILLIGG